MKKSLLLLAIPFVFFACKKDKEESLHMEQTEVTIHHNETAQLKLVPATTATWESEDTTVAKVSATGLVTAGLVGDTKINAKLTTGEIFTCNLHVTPVNSFFKEPVTAWGQSQSFVKSAETRTFYGEVEGMLLFNGENSSVASVTYAFNNDSLMTSLVLFTGTTTYTQVKNFIEERYYFVEEVTDDPEFQSIAFYANDKGTYIMVSEHIQYGVSAMYFSDIMIEGKSVASRQLKKMACIKLLSI
jgi:hypothetical protein